MATPKTITTATRLVSVACGIAVLMMQVDTMSKKYAFYHSINIWSCWKLIPNHLLHLPAISHSTRTSQESVRPENATGWSEIRSISYVMQSFPFELKRPIKAFRFAIDSIAPLLLTMEPICFTHLIIPTNKQTVRFTQNISRQSDRLSWLSRNSLKNHLNVSTAKLANPFQFV